MDYPTLTEERKLWKQGYRFVACIDEVGRGPLAGPVVACAVCFVPKLSRAKENLARLSFRLSFPHLRDSKKLSPKRRKEYYRFFLHHPNLEWGIGKVYPVVIDRINIYQATKLAMEKALMNLHHKLQKNHNITKSCYSKKRLHIDFLILDGNMTIDAPFPQEAIVKADEKVFSCAAASIIAKVTRDRMMVRYHKKYPQYGFHKHKGYGTKHHVAMLKKHGPCPLHRKTFAPVSRMTHF